MLTRCLWWGESVKSAQRKCEKFRPFPNQKKGQVFYAFCVLDAVTYQLAFTPKGKLNLVTWDITPESYAQCVKEIVAAVGASGRSEGDDGREVWTVAYMKDTAKLGYVSCVDFSDGHHMTFATGFN